MKEFNPNDSPAPFFTVWIDNPISKVLQTGYKQFYTDNGLDGLAKMINPDSINILAIASKHPGKGNFRNFISQCKEHFNTINVLEISNQKLESALERYGFKETTIVEKWGEIIQGMTWTRNEPIRTN